MSIHDNVKKPPVRETLFTIPATRLLTRLLGGPLAVNQFTSVVSKHNELAQSLAIRGNLSSGHRVRNDVVDVTEGDVILLIREIVGDWVTEQTASLAKAGQPEPPQVLHHGLINPSAECTCAQAAHGDGWHSKDCLKRTATSPEASYESDPRDESNRIHHDNIHRHSGGFGGY